MKKGFSIKNLKISQEMFIFLLILNGLSIISFIIFLMIINHLNSISHNIMKENVTSIQAAYNLENSLLNLKGLRANYYLDSNAKWITEFDNKIEEFFLWHEEALKSALTKQETILLRDISVKFNNYLSLHKKIIALAGENATLGKKLLLEDSYILFNDIYKDCEELIEKNKDLITGYLSSAKRDSTISFIAGYAIVISIIVLSILFIIILSKKVFEPIELMSQISDKYIQAKANKPNLVQDEIGQFKTKFATVIESLDEKHKLLIKAERRAAVGEITAGVSHELNNPIGIIYGFAERLLVKENLNPVQKDMVEKIFNEAERCKSLLREFLDYAKPLQLNSIKFYINDLLKETVSIFSEQEKYGSISFKMEIPDKMYKVTADNFRLKQVFLNIIINAIDALKTKTEKEIYISLVENGGNIAVKIRDNGEGIRPENLNEVFKPFFSTKHKGIGLGLSISKEIIEKHNGELSVTSEYKQWTEFQITLPIIN